MKPESDVESLVRETTAVAAGTQAPLSFYLQAKRLLLGTWPAPFIVCLEDQVVVHAPV